MYIAYFVAACLFATVSTQDPPMKDYFIDYNDTRCSLLSLSADINVNYESINGEMKSTKLTFENASQSQNGSCSLKNEDRKSQFIISLNRNETVIFDFQNLESKVTLMKVTFVYELSNGDFPDAKYSGTVTGTLDVNEALSTPSQYYQCLTKRSLALTKDVTFTIYGIKLKVFNVVNSSFGNDMAQCSVDVSTSTSAPSITTISSHSPRTDDSASTTTTANSTINPTPITTKTTPRVTSATTLTTTEVTTKQPTTQSTTVSTTPTTPKTTPTVTNPTTLTTKEVTSKQPTTQSTTVSTTSATSKTSTGAPTSTTTTPKVTTMSIVTTQSTTEVTTKKPVTTATTTRTSTQSPTPSTKSEPPRTSPGTTTVPPTDPKFEVGNSSLVCLLLQSQMTFVVGYTLTSGKTGSVDFPITTSNSYSGRCTDTEDVVSIYISSNVSFSLKFLLKNKMVALSTFNTDILLSEDRFPNVKDRNMVVKSTYSFGSSYEVENGKGYYCDTNITLGDSTSYLQMKQLKFEAFRKSKSTDFSKDISSQCFNFTLGQILSIILFTLTLATLLCLSLISLIRKYSRYYRYKKVQMHDTA